MHLICMKEISCRRFISIKRYFDRSFSNPRPLKLSRLDVLLLSVLARTSNKVWAKVWGSAQNAFPGPISPKLSKKAAIFHTELDENLQTIITLQLIFTAPIFLFHFFFRVWPCDLCALEMCFSGPAWKPNRHLRNFLYGDIRFFC